MSFCAEKYVYTKDILITNLYCMAQPSCDSLTCHSSDCETNNCLNNDYHDNDSEIGELPDFIANFDIDKENTIILFDWDDTLLISTYLANNGYTLNTPADYMPHELLGLLADSVIRTLKNASKFGKVVIVTNGEIGWVPLSALKFVPSIVPVLTELNIEVISARSAYEFEFPDQPTKWKISAFEKVLIGNNYYNVAAKTNNVLPQTFIIPHNNTYKNVLSIGDSDFERDAIKIVTSMMPNTLCKSVKLHEKPSFEQLTKQHELINNSLEHLINHKTNLDMYLNITPNI
jgi:hypothetical protein